MLPKRRFFIRLETLPETLPEAICVTDPFTVGHALKVLRLKPGDDVLVLDEISGTAYVATVDESTKNVLNITLQEEAVLNQQALPPVILAAGVIKEQHWEWLLQKATELGVSQIIPLETKFSDIQPRMIKMERWLSILKAATLQSEGSKLPKISELSNLSELLKTIPGNAHKLILAERQPEQPMLMAHLNQLEISLETPVVLLVGPEGGWHSDELTLLTQAGFQPVSLGHRVLRAETAGIVALSSMMQVLEGKFA